MISCLLLFFFLSSIKLQRLKYSCEMTCFGAYIFVFYLEQWHCLFKWAEIILMGMTSTTDIIKFLCTLFFHHLKQVTLFSTAWQRVLIYNQADFCRHNGFAIQYLGNVIFYLMVWLRGCWNDSKRAGWRWSFKLVSFAIVSSESVKTFAFLVGRYLGHTIHYLGPVYFNCCYSFQISPAICSLILNFKYWE